jgi:hypothetical protein
MAHSRGLEEEKRATDASQLLLEIARCHIAQQHCQNPKVCGPCSAIVSVQKTSRWENFQVPEPWSGDLVKARILFLSSNPSINMAEVYPNASSTDSELRDFFESRFAGHWIRDGKYPRLKTEKYGSAVKYWSNIRGRASELMNDPKPGVDFALSEIVHCKSEREEGVDYALSHCTDRYLERLLSCTGARVIVLVGRKTLNRWNELQLELPKVLDREGTDLQWVAGRERFCVFLPHPAGFEPQKRFSDRVSAAKLNEIRSFLLRET